MNFNELMSKMRELDQPTVSEAQIEECGEMPGASMGMSHEDPKPSMSLNLNAQGLDNIAELMKLMTKVNPDMINQKDSPIASMAPSGNEPEIEIIPMDKPKATPVGAPPMSDLMKSIKDIETRPELPANDGKDIDGVDIGGHEEPEGEEEEEGGDEEKEEAFGNAPTGATQPQVKDTEFMTQQLAGGMNKPHSQFKHSYRAGDNPMSMPESDLRAMIKAELAQRLAEAKSK